MKETNGLYHCKLSEIWEQKGEKAHRALEKVEDIHESMSEILQNVKYLNKLEKLDNLDLLVENIGNNKTTILVAKILGAVIFILGFIIAFLLTGKALGWFSLHG